MAKHVAWLTIRSNFGSGLYRSVVSSMVLYSMDQKLAVHKIIKKNASNLFSNTPHGFTNCIQGRTVIVGTGSYQKGVRGLLTPLILSFDVTAGENMQPKIKLDLRSQLYF